MKAGQTDIEVGTKVRITGLTGEDKVLNGLTGRATHPFAFGETKKGWIGVWLDEKGYMVGDNMNVHIKNTIQILD